MLGLHKYSYVYGTFPGLMNSQDILGRTTHPSFLVFHIPVFYMLPSMILTYVGWVPEPRVGVLEPVPGSCPQVLDLGTGAFEKNRVLC